MTRLAVAALTLLALAVALWRKRAEPEPPDPYAEPVPMAAWDGTARYDENSHTVRIRWTPTTTEVV